MLKKALIILAAGLLAPGLCLANSITITDGTSGVPGTVYTLTITPSGGSSFSATLSAQTVNITSDDWYINWIRLQLDGGTQPTVFGFSGPTGNWNALGDGNGQVDVLKANSFPQGGRIGFFTNGILDDGTIDIAQGALLDGTTYLWAWDFTLGAGTSLNPSPALQVGYFDGFAGQSENYSFTQMSQEFTIPAPSSLLLLGAGLLGLAWARRRIVP